MKRLLVVLGLVSAAMFAAISSGYGDAASRLAGNHPLEAEQRTAIADMDASAQLTMEIHLKPRNEAQLDKFLEELQDRHSPNFHKFLLPGEFDRSYGPLSSDVNAIADWLRDEGFTVTSAASTVQFTGTVAQAEDTFAVHIMKLSASEFSNLEDPILPSRFVPLIGYIEGLDNLMAAAPVTRIGGKLKTIETAAGARKLTRKEALAGRSQGVSALAAAQPAVDIGGISYGDVDMRNTYDVPDNVTLGSGDCIAIVGTSDFLDDSLSVFTDQFGDLPAINVTRKLVGSSDPGRNGAESEADIDLEWSHVMAPGAPIKFFYGTNLVNNITQAVTDDTCKVISISFEFCGSSPSFYTSTLDTQFKRAASQGQSVFVSSGDRGAAGSVASGGGCVAGSSGRKVSEMASDPFVTAVGGTEILSPDYDQNAVAQGYATETVWNDPDNNFPTGGAGGGGASTLFSKPSYQTGPGVPSDGHRDIPDVALLSGSPRVFYGGDSGGQGALLCCEGGTSLAAPMWAGISKDIEAQIGPLGSINPIVYELANLQYGPSGTPQGFHDITAGDNSFNGVTGFPAGTAYDQATGWGSVDYSVFATAYKNAPTPSATTTMTAAPTSVNFGNVDASSASAAKKITVSNKGKNPAFIGTVSTTAGFTIASGGDGCSHQTVALKKSCTVMVEFAPAMPGPASGSLSVPYNGGTATATLSGTGTMVTVKGPSKVTFAPSAAGSPSAAKTVTYMNLSKTATVKMGSLPAIAGPFILASGTDLCSNATIAPHGKCTLQLEAMGTVNGAIGGSLGAFSFSYGSNSGSASAIMLSGKVK